MTFDYFYKEQSDQFAFYRVPKVLIVDDTFQELSTDAKLLYGLLLDRVSLSSNSGWFDEEGRVYVIYTIKSIMRDLHCGNKKAGGLLAELEQFGLIERKPRGQGKPWTIYVKNFSEVVSKEHLKACQNDISGDVETTLQDMSKRHTKETIDMYNTGETRGTSQSYNMNYQKLGHDLMSIDELAVMDGGKCIVQVRGVRPFLSSKYDLTQHPNYPLTADADKRNLFDIEKFLNHNLILKPDDTYEVIEITEE